MKNYLIKQYLNLIIYFGYKIKINNKKVRRSMYHYFEYNNWSYATSITKIETFESKKGLVILIETHRPGLLIGKSGIFIEDMLKQIKIDLKREDIVLNLKECKLWYNLY